MLAELERRYVSIVKNTNIIFSADRNVIPWITFLSNWYWLRKEHQTRLEFQIRGLTPPVAPPTLQPQAFEAPARPRSPNYADVLFRFSETRWLIPMLRQGKFRLSPARIYDDSTLGAARADDELRKSRFASGRHVKITTQHGHEIPVIGNLREDVISPNYYVLCGSCDYRPSFFEEFSDSDACLVIHDPDTFAARLESALASVLPGWYFHHNPVEYYDPYERSSPNSVFDTNICKDFRFAYQMEYRWLCLSFEGLEATDPVDVELGPLNDVASLFPRPTAMRMSA